MIDIIEEKERDKFADLDKLAVAVLENLQREEDGIVLDTKRPFGFSGRHSIGVDICEIIEMKPAGYDEGDEVYADEQIDYALELFDEVGEHLATRWVALLRIEKEAAARVAAPHRAHELFELTKAVKEARE